jgi:hypothetical protein
MVLLSAGGERNPGFVAGTPVMSTSSAGARAQSACSQQHRILGLPALTPERLVMYLLSSYSPR